MVFCIKREQNRIRFSALFHADAKMNKSEHFISLLEKYQWRSQTFARVEDGTASTLLKMTFIKNDNISKIIPGF